MASSAAAAPDDGDSGMGTPAPSAAGLEVDWSAVAPEAMASVRMALELGLELECAPVVDAAAAVERERRALEAAAAAAEREEADGSGSEAEDEEDDGEEGAGDDDWGADESEGMGAAAGTAEQSWCAEDSADWVLQRIVRRRRSETVRGGASVAAAELTESEAGWEYLCEWKGYGERTWERGAFLKEHGFGEAVDAFHASKAPAAPTSTKKLRPPKDTWYQGRGTHRRAKPPTDCRADAMKVAKVFVKKLESAPIRKIMAALDDGHLSGSVSKLTNTIDPATKELGTSLAIQFERLRQWNVRVMEVHMISPEPAQRLLDSDVGVNRIETLFHGTETICVDSIDANGLKVPGSNGVTVRNGSAHGVGIYTSKEPHTPITFTRGNGFVYLCAGVVLADPELDALRRKEAGDWRIFKKNDLVAPLLRLKVERAVSTEWSPISRISAW